MVPLIAPTPVALASSEETEPELPAEHGGE